MGSQKLQIISVRTKGYNSRRLISARGMRQAIRELERQLEKEANVDVGTYNRRVQQYLNGEDSAAYKGYEYWTWLVLLDTYRDSDIDQDRVRFETPEAGGVRTTGGQVVNEKTLFSRPSLPPYNMSAIYHEHDLSLLQPPDTGHANPPLLIVDGVHPTTEYLRVGGGASTDGDPQSGIYGADDRFDMLKEFHTEFADDIVQLIYPAANGDDPEKLSKFEYYVLAYDIPACYLSRSRIRGDLRQQVDRDFEYLKSRGFDVALVDQMDVNDGRWDNLTSVFA